MADEGAGIHLGRRRRRRRTSRAWAACSRRRCRRRTGPGSCGTHGTWAGSAPERPGMPIDKRTGRPMGARATLRRQSSRPRAVISSTGARVPARERCWQRRGCGAAINNTDVAEGRHLVLVAHASIGRGRHLTIGGSAAGGSAAGGGMQAAACSQRYAVDLSCARCRQQHALSGLQAAVGRSSMLDNEEDLGPHGTHGTRANLG